MSGKPRSEIDAAAAYDAWAPTYDSDVNPTRDLDAEVLRRSSLSIDGRDVLELGCGTGKNTVWLAARARSLVAFDFSDAMMARARERVRASNVTFVRHDIRNAWPIANASVDMVIANLVLEHIQHLAPICRETARVLRAGGQFFLCELHPERQRAGGRAQFRSGVTMEQVHVAAYEHTVAEFVNAGIDAGLAVRGIGEHIESGAPADVPPRLLTILFEAGRL